MELLMAAGICSLLLALILLFSDGWFYKVGRIFDRSLIYIDEKLDQIRFFTGFVLIVGGGCILSVAFSYPMILCLHILGSVVLFFGLLYLFLPHWLRFFSKVSDRAIFSTDELVLGARKVFGSIFVIV